MNEREYEEIVNTAKNKLNYFGFELTASSPSSLAMELGRLAFTNDNFRNAKLKELQRAIVSFISSLFNAREDFRSMTHEQRKYFIDETVMLLDVVFNTTETIATETIQHELDKRVEASCDHKGWLTDYILNEEYWFCTKCKTKIKKRIR